MHVKPNHRRNAMSHQPMLPVAVGIVGSTGLIGSTLLKQIAEQAPNLRNVLRASIRVAGVTSSQKMALDDSVGFHASDFRAALEKGQDLDLAAFGRLVQAAADADAAPARGCAVLVDCTASDEVPDYYVRWIKSGLHVVAPNKKFGAGPLARYNELHPASQELGRHFLYEATVGAGLPVLSTLRSLLETGDKIKKIEGILSGTLSYIFNTYKPGTPFSDVVADAKAKGYTEPDPREDLSGMDVARKVVILARECGLQVELGDLRVDSLVPAALAGPDIDVPTYMARLPEFDGEVGGRASEAAAAGEVIRYVGAVDIEAGTASVSLVRYPASHAFSQLSGSDNMIVFTTERYSDRPLIVRGPGAGAEVTAAGVFSDLIQIVRCHG